MKSTEMADINRLLEFWLGSSDPAHMLCHRKEWWVKDPEFDQRIADEFMDLFDQAVEGKLATWQETPLGCLALVILLDQFPRNIFRNDQRAFAMDAGARRISRHVLAKGFDQVLPMGAKLFFYLPLEHSENLNDQFDCLKLMKAMGDEGYLNFAQKHLDIIERFGRFPHRNAILGRMSTEEEIAFLKEPNSRF
jgi:uncharacterized protein (DUF924 family)